MRQFAVGPASPTINPRELAMPLACPHHSQASKLQVKMTSSPKVRTLRILSVTVLASRLMPRRQLLDHLNLHLCWLHLTVLRALAQ